VVSNGETTIVADLAAGSLATAGSGDVLAGTVGGLLAQTRSPFDSAVLAVYVGPRAALRVEDRFGMLGVVATDLPDAIANELALLVS
jgi:NAD(P)H-hydrate epimerase